MVEELVEYYMFTDEQAQYAADNCGVDWDDQALKYVIEPLRYPPE